MSARTNRWVIAAAIATLIVGAILSRVIEPGVRVEKVMLTANTPALRLFPATPGPHPIALLAHGATGSKENAAFVSARRSPPLVLIAIPWIRRDMENRRNLAPSGTSMESGAGPPTSCSSPGSLSGHLDRWTSSSAIRWVVALVSGACSEDGFRPKLFIGVGARRRVGRARAAAALVGRFI